jgi:ribosome-associated translation inhibitor RaiA
MVRLLRKIREKEVADKFFRRVLRLQREPQINLICKKHNIDPKMSLDQKIREIINEGISFSGVLSSDIHKSDTTLSDKKVFLNNLWSKSLNLSPALKGSTIEEKIANIISHFENIEKDEKVGISIDGYEKLLLDLEETLPKLNGQIKTEFEIQDEKVLQSDLLLDYNIKPWDVLDLVDEKSLERFCKVRDIKTRGNNIGNILDAYKDSENLYLENYVNIGHRDLNALKDNGIRIKESELGIKFEELTKSIFNQLGLNVDEQLKKKLNTKKDKIDILLNIDGEELMIIECKTVKESGYNKFSSVSRQIKSYYSLAADNGYRVSKLLLVAPDFSDDFVTDCEMDSELNLSLLSASSLINILEAFKKSKKHQTFPYKLLMRDVLIQEDRIIKAIGK